MKMFLALPLFVSLVSAAPMTSLLERAVDENNVGLARIAISSGISPDVPITKEYVTALMLSAELGNVEMIQYLTEEARASITKTDNFGFTALHFACGANGSFLGLRACLAVQGVNVNAQESGQGNTALHFTLEILRLLQLRTKITNWLLHF